MKKLLLMMMLAATISHEILAGGKTDDIKLTAEAFVTTVDQQDAEALQDLLHPDMVQFAYLGDKVMPFKGTDFVQMIAEKKLGGKPRSITHKSAQIIRGNTAEVVLQAVSEEYDFMYQISLAKVDGKWLIVSVLSDITAV